MSAKKLINETSNLVDEALAGYVSTHHNVSLLSNSRVVYRNDCDEKKDTRVAIICGGGSGHEPAHIGYVGEGMLSAAVCGDVFASPSAKQVEAAIMKVGGKAGVLVVIKCYTGDRLHFTLAAERCKAKGIEVEMVVVGEDVAIPGNSKSLAGRRGLCATIWAYKAAGSVAAAGGTLKETKAAAEKVAENSATMNVALGPCVLPGHAKPSFTLEENEIELGLGIHGEAGYMRTKIQSAASIVKDMIDLMISTDEDRNYLPLQKGDRVALIVNNLGASTNLELSIVAREALIYLNSKLGIIVERLYSGSFMTAIDMPGISLTLIKVDIGMLVHFDSKTKAAAWPHSQGRAPPHIEAVGNCKNTENSEHMVVEKNVSDDINLVLECIRAVANVLIEKEKELTDYDTIVGDGDCGTTLEEAGRAILKAMEQKRLHKKDITSVLQEISLILEDNIGGSSGALYCIGIEAAARTFSEGGNICSPSEFGKAFKEATRAIMQLGGRKGFRTMLDAMIPVVEVLDSNVENIDENWKSVFEKACEEALKGAKSTAQMTAGAGRTTYVNKDRYMGTPDPGAMAVAYWVKSIFDQVSK